METIIVSLIIIGILSLAISKIIKDKKNGVKCCGCTGCDKIKSCPGNNIEL